MEKKGKGVGSSGDSDRSAGEGGGSWAQVVAGRGPGPVWTSSPLSVREVEEFESYFSAALVLPVGEIGEEKERWEGKAVIMRSLGRRVPPAWAGRDIRLRLGLGADPEVTPIAEDHFLVRFEEEKVCDRAIQEAPWVVGGQLLAMEPWRPAFVPARRPISKAVVWLRLPGLPVECWRPSLIMAIAAEAGKPLSLDSFTEKQRRRGFARVKVQVDSSQPVKPGVVVEAGGVRFWQQFQFENLPPVCFLCGLLGHVESGCAGRTAVVEGGTGGVDLGDGPRKPRLGPWISTSRIRQPRASPTGGSRWAGPGPGKGLSSGPSSSSPPSNPRSSSSPPGSPPDLEGWQKPSKVARRVRVEEEGEVVRCGGAIRNPTFAPLLELGDAMEVGGDPLAPTECRMLDPEQSMLKRPRSPPVKGKGRQPSESSTSKVVSSDSSRSSLELPVIVGSSQGSSPGTFSSSAPHSEGQVFHISTPCLSGADGFGEEISGELGEKGGGTGLVQVEVGLLAGGRGGPVGVGSVAGMGVRGPAGAVGLGGLEEVGGVSAGGKGRGSDSLVLVGIREVDVRGERVFGGFSSVTLEGGEGEAGRGVQGGCSGSRSGRGLGARRGGRGGRGLRSVVGVDGSSRDRSRSPGGAGRGEAVELGGSGDPVGLEGGHAVAVLGVREAVLGLSEGQGVGTGCAGASGSCG